FSRCAMAQDLGAISPTTRCRNVTMISARTNPTISAAHQSAPKPSTRGLSQWCAAAMVGSPRAGRHTVIPRSGPPSSTDRSEGRRSAARAARLPGAASSRRWRRAAMSANSTATKNALAAINPTVTATTTQGLLIAGLLRFGAHGEEHRGRNVVLDPTHLRGHTPARCRLVVEEIGAVPGQRNIDPVTDIGQSVEDGDDQTGDRFVITGRQAQLEQAFDFVEVHITGHPPAVALGDDIAG